MMKVLKEKSRKSRRRFSKKKSKGGSFPKVWADLRNTDRFSDGVIESNDGKIYRIHRVIMVAASEFLRVAFTTPLSVNAEYVKLPFSSNVVDQILEYSYTGKCHVSTDNVEELLPAADQIGAMGIVDICAKFLQAQITAGNCWGIHLFCRSYSLHKATEESRKFMIVNFAEFIKHSKEFVTMPVEDVVSLISDDYLNTISEELAFKAINKWIMYSRNEREAYATQLFESVRLGLLSSTFFQATVLSVPYKEKVSQILIDRALRAIKEIENKDRSEYITDNLLKPRVPHEVLFAVGGWSAGAPTNCIETYDIRANRWFLNNHIDQVPRSYHGLVAVDNLLYMIGGFDGSNHFNTVRCHDPIKKKWTEKACMYHARCYVCCVTLGKDIYAIGGFNGRLRMNSVEKYSIAKNQWTLISPMNRQRSDGGAAVVGDKIYVVGGFNGQEVLYSAEVYDSKTGQWYMLPSMHTPRSGVSLVYYKNQLYAIGGFNGYARLSTVERLNPDNPVEWHTDVPEMLTQRSNFASTIMDNMIYVVGGFNGSTTTAYTECFDGTKWMEISNMNLNRSALAVAICRGLPNTADYTQISRIKNGERTTANLMSCGDDSSEFIHAPYQQ